MARFELSQAIQILERTPRILRAWLAGLDAMWVGGDYGEGTFSPFEIVGHLVHGERTDWMARTEMTLRHGPAETFERFDRYAQFEECREKSLDELLNEFESARSANLARLRSLHLQPGDLQRQGRHPSFGLVTLEQLLATWVAHDLNHLGQIARAMAAQYEMAVGPWREYLGILKNPVTRMDEEGCLRQRAARNQLAGASRESSDGRRNVGLDQ